MRHRQNVSFTKFLFMNLKETFISQIQSLINKTSCLYKTHSLTSIKKRHGRERERERERRAQWIKITSKDKKRENGEVSVVLTEGDATPLYALLIQTDVCFLWSIQIQQLNKKIRERYRER